MNKVISFLNEQKIQDRNNLKTSFKPLLADRIFSKISLGERGARQMSESQKRTVNKISQIL
jgi:hypothetical protein